MRKNNEVDLSDHNAHEQIADRFAQIMIEQKLSQVDVADMIGQSRSSVYLFLRKPRVNRTDTLAAYAKVLGYRLRLVFEKVS